MKHFRFLTAIAFVFCLFVFSARAGTAASFDTPESKSMKILIVGLPFTTADALASRLAAKGVSVEIVQIVPDDGDAITADSFKTLLIAGKRDILLMATAEPPELGFSPSDAEPRKIVSKFTRKEFYDLSPNTFGYNGASSQANPIRAQPQNF